MFLILVAFSWVCLYGMKLAPLKSFNDGYISRSDTTAVKGIFVFMVFMSHFTQYYQMNTAFDNPYKWLKSNSGQLVVVMFLFYSGYGIYESLKRKGTDYIKTFPKNRCLKTMLHLDIAIFFYLIFDLILGRKFTAVQLLLSLIGWDSMGNSNWFMFAIIVQYLIVYIAFTVFREKRVPALIAVTLLSVAYIVVLKQVKESWWYNTALCLPLGMWYSYFKDGIQKLVMKNNLTYILSGIIVAGIFYVSYLKRREFVFYEIWTLAFALLVVLLTMKAHFGNKVLEWLGNRVFSVYILQRMPMIIFKDIPAVFGNRYIYFAVCFAITVVLAELFDRLTAVVDKKLFTPKKA